MKRLLVVLSALIWIPLIPADQTSLFNQLTQHITEHNAVEFTATFKNVQIMAHDRSLLLNQATDEKKALSKKIRALKPAPSWSNLRSLGLGGLLCLVSALIAAPVIINGAICIHEKDASKFLRPDYPVQNALFSAMNLAQVFIESKTHQRFNATLFWSAATLDDTVQIVSPRIDPFLALRTLALYTICVSGSTICAIEGSKILKRILIDVKQLEQKTKNIDTIMEVLTNHNNCSIA